MFKRYLNLITSWPTSIVNHNTKKNWCEIIFHLLQFKIHLNLKSDYEYERFYEKCKYQLIKESNNFNSSLKSCFNDFLPREKENYYFFENHLICLCRRFAKPLGLSEIFLYFTFLV